MYHLRGVVAKPFAAFLVLVLMVGCGPKPTDMAVCYLGSTWESGEVKSCMQDKLKGDDSPVLLCGTDAGVAFFMAAGAIESSKDEDARKRVRSVFHDRTKTFAVAFHGKPIVGDNGVPMGMWQCRRTETGVDCSI